MTTSIPLGTTSEHSRLRAIHLDYEERKIDDILEDVERRVRIMCRQMQLLRNEPNYLATIERDLEDHILAMEVFYEYVDQQMDVISDLRAKLDKVGWISLSKLREAFDD